MTATPPSISLRLGSHPKVSTYREIFRRNGRILIPDLLHPDDARRLHAALADSEDWKLAVNSETQVWDLDRATLQAWTAEQRESFTALVHRGARSGFQFQFMNQRLSESGEPYPRADHPFAMLTRFLNGPDFLAFVRSVCADECIAFADAQATRYDPGHFLTRHDDAAEGKCRRAAYVLGFTPVWRAEWGGILEFIDADGHVAEGFVPGFNVLALFRVPQVHHVSFVAPYAAAPRLSVTGWLRERSSDDRPGAIRA